MNDDKWLDLIDMIDEKFGVDKKEQDSFMFNDDIGHEYEGKIDIIYFKTPFGDIKLERVSKPLIVDKKLHYNRTAGTGAKIEYKISDTEKTYKTNAYKLNSNNEWEALDLPAEKLTF
jgi:hypothetical protein